MAYRPVFPRSDAFAEVEPTCGAGVVGYRMAATSTSATDLWTTRRLRMWGFPDSLFARANDSARITFRGGTVADEGGTRWVATRVDSSGVDFASERNVSNNFTWAPESADRWTATLRSNDREGRPRTTVYPMERIRR